VYTAKALAWFAASAALGLGGGSYGAGGGVFVTVLGVTGVTDAAILMSGLTLVNNSCANGAGMSVLVGANTVVGTRLSLIGGAVVGNTAVGASRTTRLPLLTQRRVLLILLLLHPLQWFVLEPVAPVCVTAAGANAAGWFTTCRRQRGGEFWCK
jgi:hypothetical protein